MHRSLPAALKHPEVGVPVPRTQVQVLSCLWFLPQGIRQGEQCFDLMPVGSEEKCSFFLEFLPF